MEKDKIRYAENKTKKLAKKQCFHISKLKQYRMQFNKHLKTVSKYTQYRAHISKNHYLYLRSDMYLKELDCRVYQKRI